MFIHLDSPCLNIFHQFRDLLGYEYNQFRVEDVDLSLQETENESGVHISDLQIVPVSNIRTYSGTTPFIKFPEKGTSTTCSGTSQSTPSVSADMLLHAVGNLVGSFKAEVTSVLEEIREDNAAIRAENAEVKHKLAEKDEQISTLSDKFTTLFDIVTKGEEERKMELEEKKLEKEKKRLEKEERLRKKEEEAKKRKDQLDELMKYLKPAGSSSGSPKP